MIELQLISVEQELHLNLLKDHCVVLPELQCDLSAKIKNIFLTSILHDYLGRTARIDKLEFTGLWLWLMLATKHITHMGTPVSMLNMLPDGLMCKVSQSKKSLALYLFETPSLNVIQS